jgi:hypothetical protein
VGHDKLLIGLIRVAPLLDIKQGANDGFPSHGNMSNDFRVWGRHSSRERQHDSPRGGHQSEQ